MVSDFKSISEIIDGLPAICGHEKEITKVTSDNKTVFKSKTNILFDRVRSAFIIALHMHQPTILAAGDQLIFSKRDKTLIIMRRGAILKLNMVTGEFYQYLGFLDTVEHIKGFCIIMAQLLGFSIVFNETEHQVECTLI